MASLSPAELKKRPWRVGVFIDKLKNESQFELVNKKKVKLIHIPKQEKILERLNSAELRKLVFVGTDGMPYKLTDFMKSSEFGGKGEGFGTLKEDRELLSLQKQLEDIRGDINKAEIPIKVDRKIYDVYTAVTTPGTPKSDFHLVNAEGEELVWISHKDGRTAKDFQQWGGMTAKERPVHNHREVQDFIKTVQDMYPKGIPNKTTVARKIKDKRLQNYSVYGIDYGKKLGQQNVSLLLQGPVKVLKRGQYYIFNANHVHFNGEQMKGGFEPVMMAIYKGDRNNFGVKGARFAIQPLESRKITAWI